MNGRRAPLIAGAAAVAIAILVLLLLVMPKSRQVSAAQDELDAAHAEETVLRAELGALQDAEDASEETMEQIAALDEQVPTSSDLPALLLALQAAADRAAVDLFSLAPGTPIPDPSLEFSVIPTAITVTGGYFSLDEFLFLLETLPRAAKVTSVSIVPSGTDTTTGSTTGTSERLQMQLAVEFYTTDASAGPGSTPGSPGGPTGASGVTGSTGPAPTGATPTGGTTQPTTTGTA